MGGGWQRLDTSRVTVARSEASRGGRDGMRVAEAGHKRSDSGEVRGQILWVKRPYGVPDPGDISVCLDSSISSFGKKILYIG